MTRSRFRGFTMVEMFVVLLGVSALIVLSLLGIMTSREAARRTSCSNNFVQVALAVRGYHFAFDQLPTQLSGTDGSTVPGQDNDRRLSYLVPLLPFMNMPEAWESISYPLDQEMYGSNAALSEKELANLPPWVAGGPEPFESSYPPWQTEPALLRCPSDPGYANFGDPGRTNYAACLGDGVIASDSGPFKELNGRCVHDSELAAQTDAAMRGMFVPRVVTRFSDTTDGLAHTIMLGEIATDLEDDAINTKPVAGPGAEILRDNPSWAVDTGLVEIDEESYPIMKWKSANTQISTTSEWGRGMRWADGMPLYTGFNTILPPNREVVLRDDRDDCWGILPPSSQHKGGANVCFGDSSVRFITNSIDAGDVRQPTVYLGSVNPAGAESPYGLWGAMGTRAGHELKWYHE